MLRSWSFIIHIQRFEFKTQFAHLLQRWAWKNAVISIHKKRVCSQPEVLKETWLLSAGISTKSYAYVMTGQCLYINLFSLYIFYSFLFMNPGANLPQLHG